MSLTFNGTEITSGYDLTYNGTHLTHVYFAETPNDTPVLVWAKEDNSASISTSVVSASGGSTLDYLKRTNSSYTRRHYRDDDDYCSEITGITYTQTGNALYGTYGYYTDPDVIGYVGISNTSYIGADTQCTSFFNRYTITNYTQTTANSWFDYTTTLTLNTKYASNKVVKFYVNNTLEETKTVSDMNEAITYTYRDTGVLTARTNTVALKVEIYNADGTVLQETWTGTMSSNTTIDYEG